MLNRLKTNLLSAVLVLASMGIATHAGTLTFNFNSLAENASQAAIQTYMTNTLQAVCATCTVTISGSYYADTTYNGDGHVVGPGGASLTLGNSNGATSNSSTSPGATDTFLGTVSDSGATCSSQPCSIDLVFTGLSVTNATFDFEIFPNAGSPGSFTLTAGNNGGTQSTVFTQAAVVPSSAGSDGSSTHSPNSGTGTNETVAQFIGTKSQTIANDNDIDFVDWPEAIGIDNLVLTYTTPTVPEPSSILLLASVGAFLLFKARRSFAVRAK